MPTWKSKRWANCYCFERHNIVHFSLFGQKKRFSSGLKWIPENKRLALDLLDEAAEQYQRQKHDPDYNLTLEELIEQFRDYKYGNTSLTNEGKIERAIKRYLPHQDIRVKDTTAIENQILRNIDKARETLNQNTIKKEIQFLEQIFTYAYKRNKIDVNPAKLINDNLSFQKVNRPAFTEDEYNLISKYLKNNNYRLYLIVELIANTGMRITEVMNVRHQDIHDDYFIIKGKGSRDREFPLVGRFKRAKEVIDETIKHQYGKTRIFGYKHPNAPRKFFIDALQELDLYQEGRSFHSIRKLFINQLADENYPLKSASDILGHSIRIMEKHYLERGSKKRLKDIAKKHERKD